MSEQAIRRSGGIIELSAVPHGVAERSEAAV